VIRSPRPTRSLRLAPATLAVLLVAAACSAAPTTSPGGDAPGTASPIVRPSPSLEGRISPSPSTEPVTGEVPPAVVDAARSLLGEEVGAEAAAAATIVVAEAVTWPDGALGCPVPGMMYTQQLVDGYRLVFAVDGTEYDYRASSATNIRRCELGGPRAS